MLSRQEDLRYGVSKLRDKITKGQKVTWFLGKTTQMKTKCCCVKSTVTCLWMFEKNSSGERKKNLTGTLQLIWPLKYSTFFRFSSVVFHGIGLSSVLKMAAWCLRFVAATKCCCVRAWSFKNFKHCYLSLLNSYWTIFQGSSPRRLPFSHQLETTLFALPCGASVVALQTVSLSNDSLKCGCIKGL